jgi:hypothetical protein
MDLIVNFSVEFDEDNIYPFFNYYKKYINCFNIILHTVNNTEDNKNFKDKFNTIINKCRIHEWSGDYNSIRLKSEKDKFLKLINCDDWMIHCDSDEFIELDNIVYNGNFLSGYFIDRINNDGLLLPINNNLFGDFSIKCNLSSVFNSCIIKIIATKGLILLTPGNHFLKRCNRKLIIENSNIKINHFKWNNKLLFRLERRIEMIEKLPFGTIPESWYSSIYDLINHIKIYNKININVLNNFIAYK